MHMMDDAEEWRDPDAKVRRRKSDVQGKLYNFLNRSAQSLSRSNSQSGRSRRSKEKDRDRLEQLQTQTQSTSDRDRDTPRASHAATATSSRLPSLSSSTSNAPETSRARYDSSNTRTSRSAAITATSVTSPPDDSATAIVPRKSSSPPLLQHKITVSSTPNSKTPSIAYSYNTPPQTPSRSRKYSTPSSPTSVAGTARVGTDLLLNRPLARPITPSNSGSGGTSSSRKVLGIPIPLSLPSPNSRSKTALALEKEKENKQAQGAGSPKRQTHKLRAGSGSSNEPLLRHNRVPTNESERGLPRASTSTSTSATPASTPRTNRTSDDRTPLPTPASSLPRSHRSATPREEPPASPTTATSGSTARRGTPKLDFWRSVTPRAPSAQGDREKGKQPRPATPNTPRKDSHSSQQQQEQQRPALITPQPRAFATFLPSIPHLQRIPPTPQKVEEQQQQDNINNNNRNRDRDKNIQATIRLDSFMSDSLPIVPQTGTTTTLLKASQGGEPSGLTRQPAFAQTHNDNNHLPPRTSHTLRTSRTPAPERSKHATQSPGLGIQRSNSAPGTRGRLSPCLRIPSPKFLTREKSKERDRDKEREREKEKEKGVGMGMFREKRRVTPENVGAPILRDPRTHVHVHVHAHSQVHVPGAEKGLKAPKTSLVQLRRAAHGTFDFERPGSRTSSKSGQSESRGTRSDDEREKEKEKDKENEGHEKMDRRTPIARIITKSPEPIRNGKAPSPVPPLPIPRLASINKPRSPPPPTRARSPLTTAGAAQSTTTHSHVHVDDSALPRLSSSLARRNSSSAQHHRGLAHTPIHTHARTPASLGHFSFEPAAKAPSPPSSALKPPRNAGGQYIDTPGGLIMFAPTIQEDPVPITKRMEGVGGRRRTMSSANANHHVNHATHVAHVTHAHTQTTTSIPAKQLEEATAVIAQFKNALDDAGFATLQKYVRRYDASIIPLEGGAGLLSRVQRLLETSAPRVDERKKRQLYESFAKVVTQVS